MGKVWTRNGQIQDSRQQSTQLQESFTGNKRKSKVWTRVGQAQRPKVADGGSIAPTIPEQDSGAQGLSEAKKRRLEAQGRLAPSQGVQPPNTSADGPLEDSHPANGSRAAAAAAISEKSAKQQAILQEAAALRRLIAEEEAKVAAAKAAAEKTAAEQAAKERAKREERQQRKFRLDAGFAEAFQATRELVASQKAPKVEAAGAAEVQRVLVAKNNYEVLQIKPGADKATLKKKYRTMTLALHPDKCKADKATEAFQKLVMAYQEVMKYAR